MWLTSLFKTKPAVAKAQVSAPKSPGQQPKEKKLPPSPRVGEIQPAKSSGQNQIQYDERLIFQLKSDHAAVLALYSNVANMVNAGQWDSVPTALREVRVALYGHLLTEGVKLYSYMRRNLAEDQTLFDVYRSFKKEMDGIGRAAFAFFDKYQDANSMATGEARQAFKQEFEGIGKVLVDRIGREETVLYPLYMPA